ncbi:hypothetical protein MNAN1_002322 [Malassezia nana]|uniref:2,5-diamino-6-ribosylamino-4(3H)-pyrimidinone 5'-phosphate reductase n=1 Tax=Malassezia nana TaxID=180528 RepID=A0AAF0EM28_9BASI|nr:hypothetical protein MNAN1_002322 [Malassezia nana]
MDAFLAAHRPCTRSDGRPWITLTYAQSRDGKIAGAHKQPLRLSGPASMHMTHRLRAAHDAILVGVGTMLADNPRLNVRIDGYDGPSPRPVVLDSSLRTPPSCRLWQVAESLRPLVLAAAPLCDKEAWNERRRALEAAGAHVRILPRHGAVLAWEAIIDALAAEGVRALMVEGGAGVIDGLLQSQVVPDVVIVTVSPVLVGEQGYGYTTSWMTQPVWQPVDLLELEPDTVVAWKHVP